MATIKTVDDYIHQAQPWQVELHTLRKLLCASGLIETIKWGGPCYTHHNKNVISLGAYKNHVALWFHQGALLADKNNLLINAQEGRTKAMRHWRFTSVEDIKPRLIKSYLAEAMALAASGQEIKAERGKAVIEPPELKTEFSANPQAKQAFAKLTLGKRREYADYIAEAKRDATKASRMKKILPMIIAGVGLNDKYR